MSSTIRWEGVEGTGGSWKDCGGRLWEVVGGGGWLEIMGGGGRWWMVVDCDE